MGLRELFIFILGLAIIAVFLRGVYVAIKARKGQLRMQLDKNIPEYDPEELSLSELPNGGARLVERSFAQIVQQNSDFAKQEQSDVGKAGKGIPVLMDSVDDDVQERTSSIANARQSARQKHVMGRSETLTTQLEPQPTVADDVELSGAPNAEPEAIEPVASVPDERDYPIETAHDDIELDDDDYDDDPIANHVFADESSETGELAVDSYVDADDTAEAYLGYSGDGIDDEDESESMVGSITISPDDTLQDNGDEEDILEYDHDAFEDEDFSGDGPDVLQNSREQSADDLEEDDDLEELDIASGYSNDEEIEAEPFDKVYSEENPERQGFSAYDGDSEDALDNDYSDAESFDEGEDEQQDYEAEEDAEDRLEENEQEDDLYDYDDEDGDDEDDYGIDEPALHEKEPSGPRTWFKWAGDKISGISGPRDNDETAVRGERAEPVIGDSSFDEVMTPAPRPKARPARERRVVEEPVPKPAHFDKTHQSQLDLGMPAAEPTPKPTRQSKRAAAKAEPAPKKSESTVATEFSEVLVINVVAKADTEIHGIDMLQVLMANGLIFGEMSIFHRHLEHNRESPVLFSVANMVNPGTFDLNQIAEFSTKGLCFFLTLPNVATSMQAFEKMLDAAQQIRVTLDCDLKDDSRSVMTAQTIEHYRQRVRDFDLRQLRQTK